MEIIRNNVTYTLTDDELEAAYREQQRIFRRDDAAEALAEYLTDHEGDELSSFGDKPFEEMLQDTAILDRIVTYFEASFTCDCDENTMWANAVCKALACIGDEG